MRVSGVEQSNTSIFAGRADMARVMLKSYRRLQSGTNPEVEIGKHLESSPAHAAPLLGWLELERTGQPPVTLGVVHEFVGNEGDAWTTTLRSVGSFLEQVMPLSDSPQLPPVPEGGLLAALRDGAGSETVAACLAEAGPAAELLGKRTAELHVALASPDREGEFRPEAVTPLSQRSLYQSMRSTTRRTVSLLRRSLRGLPADEQPLARFVLESEDEILGTLRKVLEIRSGARIRVHGDLHLGQVLFTGRDYVFVDFEGEPARTFGERRLKRSPLSDVAGMLRSYHYAAHNGVFELETRGALEASLGTDAYRDAADLWSFWIGAAFLAGYLPVAREAGLLPASDEELDAALTAHLLDKAIYELRYELANRPDWAYLPLLGLRFLLRDPRRGTT